MKCIVSALKLKRLLKTVTSIYDFARENPHTQSVGILSVDNKGLWVEYGSAGAYLRKREEVKILREGMAGLDLKALQKIRLFGDVTLDAPEKGSTVTVYVGKTNKYTIPKDQDAEEFVETFRPEKLRQKEYLKEPLLWQPQLSQNIIR